MNDDNDNSNNENRSNLFIKHTLKQQLTKVLFNQNSTNYETTQ